MSANDRFPQDWPRHLALDAQVSPDITAAPSGQIVLDFCRMHGDTFEQFCWWLLKKDHTLVGCQRLGGPGTTQSGIDLFASNAGGTGRLQVFECKAYKKMTVSAMTAAVDAFLGGDWAQSTDKFTLILAQAEPGKTLVKRWHEESQRLRLGGIESELWTGAHLTLKVQLYPDILTKFFPFHSVETLANVWMDRVGFYELVMKSFFDPREEVAQWARRLVGDTKVRNGPTCAGSSDTGSGDSQQGATGAEGEIAGPPPFIDGVYRTITQYGHSWHFKGPWFGFSAILPDERFSARASAAITFNRPDMLGVVLTVDHTWLMTRFLFKTGAPLRSGCRDFIVAEAHNEPGVFVVDLPHCRLSLQEEGVRDLLEVADILTIAMRKALQELEQKWSAKYFPFLMRGGRKVAIAAISKALWRAIGLFAVEHDVSKGSTSWHMFDGNAQVLKPYHESSTERFDAGYHGIFYAVEIDGLSHADEVVLLWQPDGPDHPHGYSPRKWWSCEFAAAWISEDLLPEVKRWAFARNFRTAWVRLFKARQAREFSRYLDEAFVLRDLRELPLLADGSLQLSIVDTAQVLQPFFLGQQAERCFIRPGEVDALYESVALAAHAGRGYVGYAESKLGIFEAVADHRELIERIRQYVREGRVHASSGAADGALRALLEMLQNSEAHLANTDRELISASLVPFAKLYDEVMFVSRHTKWE